jgi:Ca2+/Na+ antiporter
LVTWLKFIKLVLWDEGIIQKTVNILLIVLTILTFVFTDLYEWPYWMLALLALFFAWWFFTFSWAYKKWKKELGQNWIERHRLEHGELPELPQYLLEVVENYTAGQPISKDIKVKISSGQLWNRLDPSQRDKLLELVEWTGKDRRDYLAQMERMKPKPKPRPRITWI